MPLTGKRKAEYMAEYHRRHPEKKQAAKQRHRERQAQKRQPQEQQTQKRPPQGKRKIQNEPARRQLLRLLSDRPTAEIAQTMNASTGTIYRWLRELKRDDPGFNRPRIPTKRTPESRQRDDEIYAMYQAGRSQNQIAAIYGITRQAVHDRLNRIEGKKPRRTKDNGG